ncbi:MAG: hypothetical protein LBN04_01915 [Oscillospiraceae bacterium]|jgi:hypothetical protein|nr:hypothetical protein [Oscillospiraceae bacterium]
MNDRYFYKGQDITLDILMKTEHVVRLIADRTGQPFDRCLIDFSASRTYQSLQNTDTVMWAESAEFIADEYFRENHPS